MKPNFFPFTPSRSKEKHNAADFCRDYLGKSRSYMNTLKYTQHSPSPDAYRQLSERIGMLLVGEYKSETKDELKSLQDQIDVMLEKTETHL